MADPKSQRIEELEKQLEEQKDINAANLEVIWNWERKASEYEQKIDSLQEQCSTRYEAIEKLNAEKMQLEELIKGQADDIQCLREKVADRTKDVQYYDAENKKLMEKLDVAERELEMANTVCNNEFEKRSSLQRQYDEIKIKNQNICSTIADMVRKVMQE